MVAPLSPEQARLAAIREALPATSAGIYLNTASAGPLPAESARIMAELAASELSLGRGHPQDPLDTAERIGEARAALAAVLGGDLQAVALTRGTEDGLALAVAASSAGCEGPLLLIHDASEPSPAGFQAREAGGRILGLRVDPAEPDETLVARIAQALDTAPAPGAVLVPLVAHWTGRRLPVEHVAAIVRDRHACLIVDGGSAVGAVRVDPTALGADALAFPSERWLLGPAGLGGLWCAPVMLDRLRSLHPLGFADGFTPGVAEAPWLPATASLPRPAISGLARGAGWLAMQVGLPWAWGRTARLAGEVADALGSVPGVQVLTPAPVASATIAFTIEGWRPEPALDELGARIFALAAPIPSLRAIRISLGAWTSEDELDRLVAGVRLLAAHTPATLPPRRSLDVLP